TQLGIASVCDRRRRENVSVRRSPSCTRGISVSPGLPRGGTGGGASPWAKAAAIISYPHDPRGAQVQIGAPRENKARVLLALLVRPVPSSVVARRSRSIAPRWHPGDQDHPGHHQLLPELQVQGAPQTGRAGGYEGVQRCQERPGGRVLADETAGPIGADL